MSQYITVRIKATGQVTELVPDVARAMILGGTAEELKPVETQMVKPAAEHAVAPAQHAKPKSRR